ncbi:hypothetical protein Y032_0184g983 [Ancylostoma ceylanicum]|nr:hypothetical protein Y032_0184g983 [Ancylostoma ceylanicum]
MVFCSSSSTYPGKRTGGPRYVSLLNMRLFSRVFARKWSDPLSKEGSSVVFIAVREDVVQPASTDAGFQQVVLAGPGIVAEIVDGAAEPAVSAHDAGLMQVFLQPVFPPMSPSPGNSFL